MASKTMSVWGQLGGRQSSISLLVKNEFKSKEKEKLDNRKEI